MRCFAFVHLFALITLTACGQDLDPEGTWPGQCIDGADNDIDGLFDCADPSCFSAPDCSGVNGPNGPGGTQPPGGATSDTAHLTTTTTTTTEPPTSLSVQVTWTDDGYSPTDTNGDGFPDAGCNDSVRVRISDPLMAPEWNFGMAETDSSHGWTGEDCLNGYATFAFCHPVGLDHTLQEVPDCRVTSIVAGSTTLFDSGSDPRITYLVAEGGDCFTFGDNPSYYAALGCDRLN